MCPKIEPNGYIITLRSQTSSRASPPPQNTCLLGPDGRDPSLLLRSVVPVLEGAVSFFLDYMILADDGQGGKNGTRMRKKQGFSRVRRFL